MTSSPRTALFAPVASAALPAQAAITPTPTTESCPSILPSACVIPFSGSCVVSSARFSSAKLLLPVRARRPPTAVRPLAGSTSRRARQNGDSTKGEETATPVCVCVCGGAATVGLSLLRPSLSVQSSGRGGDDLTCDGDVEANPGPTPPTSVSGVAPAALADTWAARTREAEDEPDVAKRRLALRALRVEQQAAAQHAEAARSQAELDAVAAHRAARAAQREAATASRPASQSASQRSAIAASSRNASNVTSRTASSASSAATATTTRSGTGRVPAAAAAAAAAAVAAPAAPAAVAAAPAEIVALATYLERQPLWASGDAFRVTESVVRIVDGATTGEQLRTVIVIVRGDALGIGFKCKRLLAAALYARARFNAGKATERTRVVRLRQFASAIAYEQALDGTFYQGHLYGRFPLAPGQVSSAGDFTASYESISIMTPAEVAMIPALAVAAMEVTVPALDARSGTPLWEVSSATGTAAVDEILATLGSPIPMLRRYTDTVPRQAFRQMLRNIIDCYGATPIRGAERDAKLRRFLAFPRMHARRLTGTGISKRVRDAHVAAQLGGAICAQLRQKQNADAGDSQAALPEAAFLQKCVRSAHALVQQGFIGRAAAALQREPAVHIDVGQKVEELKKLHPSGAPLARFDVPETRFFSRANVSTEDIRAGVRAGMNGGAPGPDGWTFEMLHDALEDACFAADFVDMVIDVCNGDVQPATARVLAASSLIALAKGATADDGIRPIALGSTLLKVAAARVLHVAQKPLQRIFYGTQFGCAVKGGADYIIHSSRNFLRNGVRPDKSRSGTQRVLATIDFANAFNTPSRHSMYTAVSQVPQLLGIFSVSYAQASALHVVGADATLRSECGARQGTVDGPVAFALTLQPVLNAANAMPGVSVLAYLDDISILADDIAAADAAVRTIITAADRLSMKVKLAKCELLAVSAGAVAFPPDSPLAKFRRVNVLKLLGASVGTTDELEAAHLEEREGTKGRVLFERLRLCPGPQFFSILRQSALPKLGHVIRVQSPAVSRKTCQIFDAQTEALIEHWTGAGPLGKKQKLIMQLPRARGGLGLMRSEFAAAAAYHASRTTALDGERQVKQATLVEELVRRLLYISTAGDPELRRHLEVHSLAGSDAALALASARVHPDVWGAVLRTRLMADSGCVSPDKKHLKCPGCDNLFALGGAWGQHVASCVRAGGGFVTARHNVLAHFLRMVLAAAGFSPDATEPRDLAMYTCRCRIPEMTHDVYKEHRKICKFAGREPLHRSGPDVRFQFGGATHVADVTIVNLMTQTHAKQSAEEAFAAATAKKLESYGDMCNRAHVTLSALPATANGNLGPALKKLLITAADLSFSNRAALCNIASADIVYGSARGRLAAEQSIGIRPPTIEPSRVALLEQFVHTPAEPEPADAAAEQQQQPAGGGSLLPAPRPDGGILPPPLTLEERIATSVDHALREKLPQIAAEIVAAARRQEEEERDAARAKLRAAAEARKSNDGADIINTDNDHNNNNNHDGVPARRTLEAPHGGALLIAVQQRELLASIVAQERELRAHEARRRLESDEALRKVQLDTERAVASVEADTARAALQTEAELAAAAQRKQQLDAVHAQVRHSAQQEQRRAEEHAATTRAAENALQEVRLAADAQRKSAQQRLDAAGQRCSAVQNEVQRLTTSMRQVQAAIDESGRRSALLQQAQRHEAADADKAARASQAALHRVALERASAEARQSSLINERRAEERMLAQQVAREHELQQEHEQRQWQQQQQWRGSEEQSPAHSSAESFSLTRYPPAHSARSSRSAGSSEFFFGETAQGVPMNRVSETLTRVRQQRQQQQQQQEQQRPSFGAPTDGRLSAVVPRSAVYGHPYGPANNVAYVEGGRTGLSTPFTSQRSSDAGTPPPMVLTPMPEDPNADADAAGYDELYERESLDADEVPYTQQRADEFDAFFNANSSTGPMRTTRASRSTGNALLNQKTSKASVSGSGVGASSAAASSSSSTATSLASVHFARGASTTAVAAAANPRLTPLPGSLDLPRSSDGGGDRSSTASDSGAEAIPRRTGVPGSFGLPPPLSSAGGRSSTASSGGGAVAAAAAAAAEVK